jgi:hypothetical protein
MGESKYSDLYYYCEDSPTGLRRAKDWTCGMNNRIFREPAGSVAGGLAKDKYEEYYKVKANGKTTATHRIIWDLHHGPIPEGYTVDHIDGNTVNNKIDNLRCVLKEVNSRNQKAMSTGTSGACGVNLGKYKELPYMWKARWNGLDGKQLSKSFSIPVHGNDEAFRLACEHREKMISELNEQGAGYTNDHGKR